MNAQFRSAYAGGLAQFRGAYSAGGEKVTAVMAVREASDTFRAVGPMPAPTYRRGITRFVAEITLTVAPDGSTQTFYVATSGFSTRPTDTPANTHISGRLKNAGSVSRSLFSGTRVFGAVKPSFGVLSIRNGDSALDAWLGYAASGGRVVVRMGDEDAPYPAGYSTVFIAYARRLHASLEDIEVHLKDRLELLDKPLIDKGFDGTGGLEGTTGVTGKLRQWVSETPGYIPPISVDFTRRMYYVQSTPCMPALRGAHRVYEGGVEITREPDYNSSAELLSVSPSSGRARYWFGPQGVYFRLGSTPVHDLRCVAAGQQQSGAAWTIVDLAAQAGITGGQGLVPVLELLVDDDRTYLQVMQDASIGSIGYFGMTRLDQFVCGGFNAPTGPPVHTFTLHNASRWQKTHPDGMDAPVWRVTMNSGRTWPSNLAAGAPAEIAAALTRTPWNSSFVTSSQPVLTANPGAVHAVVETPHRQFTSPFTHGIFASRYLALFGVRRDFYTCVAQLDEDTVAIELHDVVEIRMPRFDLHAGKLFRVISQEINCVDRRITFGLWG